MAILKNPLVWIFAGYVIAFVAAIAWLIWKAPLFYWP